MPTVKEYKNLTSLKPRLDDEELTDLKQFAIDNQYDKEGNHRPVLQLRNNNDLRAQNYVGIITTRKGTMLEILPKVDLSSDENNKETKKIFFDMLRTWRGLSEAQFSQSNINALQRFNMLEAFVRLFLDNLVALTRRGLAKHYQAVEDNLACLKGRLLFPQHLRINLTNQARFYVRFDEFARPTGQPPDSQCDPQTDANGKAASKSTTSVPAQALLRRNPAIKTMADRWNRHSIDRTMQHYNSVMQWVGLFLFGYGLTTFQDKHVNQSLLFPMEEVLRLCYLSFQETPESVQCEGARAAGTLGPAQRKN